MNEENGFSAEVRPLVSIGLPVYNGERFLKRAIKSLLDQDYTNIELIIGDNCSTDKTPDICKAFARIDPRVRYIRHDANRGAHFNFEFVVTQALGEFFMWGADDDYWIPQFVSRLVAELQAHPDAVVAMCATQRVHEDGTPLDIIRFSGASRVNERSELGMATAMLRPFKHNMYIYGLYRADVMRRGVSNFPRALGGDRMLVAQFALAGRFRYVDTVLYVRTHRPKHEDSYRDQEKKLRTKATQLYQFTRMLLRSPVIPISRKLFAPWFVAWYGTFVFRRELHGMKEKVRYFVRRLVNKSSVLAASTLAFGLIAVGAGTLIFGEGLSVQRLALSALAAGLLLAIVAAATGFYAAYRSLIQSHAATTRKIGSSLDNMQNSASELVKSASAVQNTADVLAVTVLGQMKTRLETQVADIQRQLNEKQGEMQVGMERLLELLKALSDTVTHKNSVDLEIARHSILEMSSSFESMQASQLQQGDRIAALDEELKSFNVLMTETSKKLEQNLTSTNVSKGVVKKSFERLNLYSGDLAKLKAQVADVTTVATNLQVTVDGLAKEIKYAVDLGLSPPRTVEGFLDAPVGQYGANRQALMRKEILFARELEASRIRELFLEEIFPDIGDIDVSIGVVNELSGHANRVDMAFVAAIAKHRRAQRVFEFGTYMGRTTLRLAQATPTTRVTTLDLPIDANERYGRFNGVLFHGRLEAERIEQRFENSFDLDTGPLEKAFDFVFIDADHSYEAVKNDTEKALKLLKPGGVVMWHDYAPKSDGLVRFIREFSQDQPLFRIRRTCLLLHIDGVDPMTFKAATMPESLESEHYRIEPHRVEEIYHH